MREPWTRKEVIGDCTLYLGDCLEVMPALGKVDAVVTDPPYGVNGGSGTLGKASNKTKYSDAFPDTLEYLRDVSVSAVSMALSMSGRGAITPGNQHAFEYPKPDDMGIMYQPAATGLSQWGRCTSQPILFYGRDPKVGLTIQPKHIVTTKPSEKNGHPCPKPLYVMKWLVNRASVEGETILDPFMGSGTTLVACAKLGRKGIGIELDPDYFEIACKRVQAAYDQPDLFVAPPTPPTQEGMDL
jgi:DNA modification methylase